jgi:hypothetical protein
VPKNAKRLADMKAAFLMEVQANKGFPIGARNRLRIRPQDRVATPYKSGQFNSTTTRRPEFAAPGLGRESSHVTVDAELGDNASGVLYALGGFSGGLALYMDKGELFYEYNMMIIERYAARSKAKLAAGKHKIEVDTTSDRPGAPAEVVLTVDGAEVARTTVKLRCLRPSRPAGASTSASISARRYRWSTSTVGRSGSMEGFQS